MTSLLMNRSNDPDMLNNSKNTTGLPATALQAAKPTLACDFCGLQGHLQANCFRYRSAKTSATQEAQEKAQERKRNRSRGGKNAANNAASTTDSASAVKEFAGKASLRSTTPSQVSELDADVLWTADTGATSHMTPNRHWLRDYEPLRTPIRLANNTIVYSAGVGKLLFAPESGVGSHRQQVLFSRVLHVPELG